MPYYLFSIVLSDGPPRVGMRRIESHDIDAVWRIHEYKARQNYGKRILSFDVVMISKLSPEYQSYVGRNNADHDELV
jgi:hypothetical protein